MNDVLYKSTVLVLNRNWQAIDVKTPAQAFCMMANGNATALDIQGTGDMRPARWSEWLELETREQDNAVRTVRGLVRVPTVLVLARYNKVPKRRPKLSARGIWKETGENASTQGKSLVRTKAISITSYLDPVAGQPHGRIAFWQIRKSIA